MKKESLSTVNCQQARQEFSQLRQYWEDFKFELTQVETLVDVEKLRHLRANISRSILETRATIDTDKLELRQKLAEQFGYVFVDKPNQSGTMVAHKDWAGKHSLSLIDKRGKVLFADFSLVKNSSEGVMCVLVRGQSRLGSEYLYIDEQTGEVITESKVGTNSFKEGKVPKYIGYEKIVFVNKKGKEMGGGTFVEVEDFSEGLAWVMPNKNYGYFMDKKGRKKSNNFMNSLGFHEGLAAVMLQDGWYFVDKSFDEIAGPFDEVGNFQNGVCRAKKGNRYGVIDRTGHILFGFSYEKIREYSEGRTFATKKENPGWIFLLDDKGNVITSIEAELACDFKDGVAIIRRANGDELYVDKNGDLAVQEVYEIASEFSEGLASVIIQGQDHSVFIDRNFQVVIPGPFEDPYDLGSFFEKGFVFKGGVAEVQFIGETGFSLIDKNGNRVFKK